MQNRPTFDQRRFARRIRASQTDCEQMLWHRLRARQVAGLKFRRQVPVPPFVLDFYCVELRLAVELDGGQHYEAAGEVHDRRRTLYLQRLGIEVVRFSNLEVIQQMGDVLEQIVRVAEVLRSRS